MQDVREYMTTISTVVTDVRGGRLAAAAATAAAATAAVYVVAKSGSYLLGSKGGSFWGRFGFLDKYVCEFMLLMGCSFSCVFMTVVHATCSLVIRTLGIHRILMVTDAFHVLVRVL